MRFVMLGKRSFAAAPCAAALLLGSASAQISYDYWEVCDPTHRFHASPIDGYFPRYVENPGDLDQDGVDDLLIPLPDSDRQRRDSGAVRAYSMASGSLLYVIRGNAGGYFGGLLGSGGDVDADGTPDWVATEYAPASAYLVHVHSGVDGSRILSLATPPYVSALTIVGDTDADGHDDVLVGSQYEDSPLEDAGAARLFSGRDGSLLRLHAGARRRVHFGSGVSGIGDVDGDGHGDYAVGARDGGATLEGEITAYSGADGTVLYTLAPSSPLPRGFGTVMSRSADLDGDGLRDLVVFDDGAYFGHLGQLYAFSGATGALIWTTSGTEYRHIEGAAANLGDANGDGIGDVVAFVRLSHSESVEIFSGADGRLLRTYHGPYNYEGFVAVTGLGDVNGDGAPELFVGSASRRSGLVFSTATPTSVEVCAGEPNSSGEPATIFLRGSRSLSENGMSAGIRNVAAWQHKQFFYGARRTHVPFGQGTLCVRGPRFRIPGASHPSNSGISFDFTQPPFSAGPGALQPGSTWIFQAWYRDGPGGANFNVTNAVSATFCP